MSRIIWIYGSIAGLILAGSFAIGYVLGAEASDHTPLLGYSIMLVALSFVFMGVKRHRDTVTGGVIRFWPAFGVGIAIAGVASLFYVIGWEIYMAATDFSFMSAYIDEMVRTKQAAGASAAEIAKMKAEFDAFAEQYRNPAYRIAITFAEIAPVGLLVALISAALLRNSRFLPARAER